MQLSGKVALVTGAARGIGRGVALELARAGADICVTDRAPGSESAEVAAAIQSLGRRALAVQADITERAAVERMVAQCTANLGPVDILVAGAVTSVRQSLLETQEADLRRSLEVSILGTFHTFQIVARQMVERRAKGSLIYISSPHARLPMNYPAASRGVSSSVLARHSVLDTESIRAFWIPASAGMTNSRQAAGMNPRGFKGEIDYNTAKAGAHQLALSAANELMWYGIRVNLIEPGWTDTPGERTWYTDEILYREGAKLPLGRLATPEDIGRASVFLASDEAAYVAGAVLRVDGGAFIQGPAWYAPTRHGGEEPVRHPGR